MYRWTDKSKNKQADIEESITDIIGEPKEEKNMIFTNNNSYSSEKIKGLNLYICKDILCSWESYQKMFNTEATSSKTMRLRIKEFLGIQARRPDRV